MTLSNAAYELADRLAERERAAGIAKIQMEMARTSGRLVCDCGEPICEARRRAVPSTDKCAACAWRLDRLRRRP